MKPIRLLLWLLLACALVLTGGRKATAGAQYFWQTTSNSETGSALGANLTTNPKDWPAVHSQFDGSTLPDGSLRIGGQQGSNFTFVWTRPAGNKSAYNVDVSFTILKGYNGRIELQYGLDNVVDHTQVPWPKGYWVDNETNWTTLDTNDGGYGKTVTLTNAGKTLTIPASANSLYLRVYLPESADSNFVTIIGGSIQFKTNSGHAEASITSPVHLAAVQTAEPADPIEVPAGSQHADAKNVVAYGADPTGHLDSTQAIQAAVDAGGVIVIPQGQFLISKAIQINKSFTEIKGDTGSTLMLADDAAVDGIRASIPNSLWELHDITVEGLTLVNSDTQNHPGDNMNFTSGIVFDGVRNGRIQNCTVEHFQEQGLNLVACRNIHVTGCTAIGARHGIGVNGNEYIGDKGGSYNVQIDGCRTDDTWDTGIVVGVHADFTTVSNCLVEHSWAHGIDIFNTSNAVITGNTVRDWNALNPGRRQTGRSIGIFVHLDWGLTVAVPTRNITVTNNLVIYDEPLARGLTPSAMEISGDCDGVNVTGNTLVGSYQALRLGEQSYDNFYKSRIDKRPAVAPQMPRNVVFSNNVCRSQEGSVLSVASILPMTAIISNNFFSPKANASFELKVSVAKNVVITNNVFQSTAITPAALKGYTASGNVFLPSPALPDDPAN